MLSKEKIVDLYSNLTFPGAYYGAHNFYKELLTKFGSKNVPSSQTVLEILETVPTFQIHAPYHKTKYFRHLDNVSRQGLSLQLDLAFMPKISDFVVTALRSPWIPKGDNTRCAVTYTYRYRTIALWSNWKIGERTVKTDTRTFESRAKVSPSLQPL